MTTQCTCNRKPYQQHASDCAYITTGGRQAYESTTHTKTPWPDFQENDQPQWDENFSFEEAIDPTTYKSFVRMTLDDYRCARRAVNNHNALVNSVSHLLTLVEQLHYGGKNIVIDTARKALTTATKD